MSLVSGTRLGPYEIVALIGAGGMGEVYRATDMNLARPVAIKVLPDAVASDADRLVRFDREAKTLAALNHPNIGAIYGLEKNDGNTALVMELVEGPTLADRITQGPIPVDEALPMARQIAEALEAAHEQGIIHRDLKPANIKVRPDGTVKVLDFGLAKVLAPSGAPTGDATISPTISRLATEAGIVLGTAAYMSPEQARGRIVDRRSDIWAFGCVLYEMLTGTRAFRADDVTDTIVAVVSKEPDWQKLPARASAARPLIERCLRKDPKQRLQAMGDARIQIDELMSGPPEATAVTDAQMSGWRKRIAWFAIGVASGGLIAAALTSILSRPTPQPAATFHFAIVPPPAHALNIIGADRNLAISRDGRYIVYRAGPVAQLVLRRLDSLDETFLPSVTNARWPFFSPDGQWIGFFDGASLKKVSIAGGTPITICENPFPPRGATWDDDNTILFANRNRATGLMQVSAIGGKATVLTSPETDEGEHWYPSLLPGGQHVLFTITERNRPDLGQIAVLDLRSGERKLLIRGTHAEFVATGHLVYIASGTLHAVRFDPKRLEVLGDPLPVVDNILASGGLGSGTGVGNYAVSGLGTLVVVPGDAARARRSLVWVDRKGRETPLGAPPRAYTDVQLSPDGTRVALGIRDQENDIYIWHLAGGPLRRLTFGPSLDQSPVWTSDSQRILFRSDREGTPGVFAQAADGSGVVERLLSVEMSPTSLTPDGSAVLGWRLGPKTAGDIVRAPLAQSDRTTPAASQPVTTSATVDVLVQTSFGEINPVVSPNGRYVAYQSNAGGGNQVYVQPLGGSGEGLWQVSTDGGTGPAWARNGQELFYLDASNVLTSLPVQISEETFTFGHPRRMLDSAFVSQFGNPRPYDVSPDGQRFLMIKDPQPTDPSTAPARIDVVVNWHEELKRLVPTR